MSHKNPYLQGIQRLSAAHRQLNVSVIFILVVFSGCATPDRGTESNDRAPIVAGTAAQSTENTPDDTAKVEEVHEVVSSTTARSTRKCRMRRVTGSHIAREQCFTEQEVEDLEQASKSLLRTGGSRGGAYRIHSEGDPRN